MSAAVTGAIGAVEAGRTVFPGPIALLGLRGAGKSTVGRILARRLGRPCIDLDDETALCARRAGWRVEGAADLLRRAGQAHFREFESQALRRILEPGLRVVLATGGGVVERSDARAWLARSAYSVWLDVSLELLRQRVEADGAARRPSLTGADPVEELGFLLARRRPLFAAVADHTIAVGERDAEAVAAAIQVAVANSSP